jgi:hypothetical protein
MIRFGSRVDVYLPAGTHRSSPKAKPRSRAKRSSPNLAQHAATTDLPRQLINSSCCGNGDGKRALTGARIALSTIDQVFGVSACVRRFPHARKSGTRSMPHRARRRARCRDPWRKAQGLLALDEALVELADANCVATIAAVIAERVRTAAEIGRARSMRTNPTSDFRDVPRRRLQPEWLLGAAAHAPPPQSRKQQRDRRARVFLGLNRARPSASCSKWCRRPRSTAAAFAEAALTIGFAGGGGRREPLYSAMPYSRFDPERRQRQLERAAPDSGAQAGAERHHAARAVRG